MLKARSILSIFLFQKSTQWKNGDAREGSNLTLTEISRKDAGQYVCIASNKVGAPAKEEITLRAHCK